jgi:hypothetical protein
VLEQDGLWNIEQPARTERSGWRLDILTPDLGDRIDLAVETQLVPVEQR